MTSANCANLTAQEIFEAARISCDAHTSSDDRAKAHLILKQVADNALNFLKEIFRLISPENPVQIQNCGLHFLEHFIRQFWNCRQNTNESKIAIKTEIFNNMTSTCALSGSECSLIRECYAKCINELAKKEFPQNWPTFFEDCSSIASTGINQYLVVLSAWTRLFEDVVVFQNVTPLTRRKELHAVLLDDIEKFIEFSFSHLVLPFSSQPTDIELGSRVMNLEFLSLILDMIPLATLKPISSKLFPSVFGLISSNQALKVSNAAARCLCSFMAPKTKNVEYWPVISDFASSSNVRILLTTVETLCSFEFDEIRYTCLKTLSDLINVLAFNISYILDETFQDDSDLTESLRLLLSGILLLLQHPSLILRFVGSSTTAILTKNSQFYKVPYSKEFLNEFVRLTPEIITLIGYPSKQEGQRSDYSRLEFETDADFVSEFSKFRESVITSSKRIVQFDPSTSYKLLKRFYIEKLTDFVSNSQYAEWEAWNRISNVVIGIMSETESFNSKEISEDLKSIVQTVLNLLKNSTKAETADLLLSTLSSLYPALRHCTNFVQEIVVQIFRLALWPDLNSSSTCRKLKHHAMHEFVHMAVEQTKTLLPYVDEILAEIEKRASQLTLRQMCNLAESFVVLSNEFQTFEQHQHMINYLSASSVAYLSSDEVKNALENSNNFAAFVGLHNFDSEIIQPTDLYLSRRKEILGHVLMLGGILNRCVPGHHYEVKEPSYQDGRLRHPAFEVFLSVIPQLFNLAKCLNGLYQKQCVDKFHSAYSGYKVLSLMEYEKNFNVLAAMALAQSEKENSLKTFDSLQLFTADLIEKTQILLGFIVSKFDWQFFDLPNADKYLLDSLSYIEDILDQRLRFWIRRLLLPVVFNLNGNYCPKVMPVLHLLIKHVYQRLSQRWHTIKSRLHSSDRDQDDLTQQEIFFEDLTRLFTREYLTFLRACLCKEDQQQNAKNFKIQRGLIQEDDEEIQDGEHVEMKDDRKKESQQNTEVFACGVSVKALGVDLLSQKSECLEPLVLTVFHALTWLDTLSVVKAVELGGLIIKQLRTTSLLNETTTEHLFSCALHSIQIHGEHDIAFGRLLGFLCFLHESLAPSFRCVRRLLLEIPSCSAQKLDSYEEKVLPASSRTVPWPAKCRRDAFKKLINGIIGENIGQKFKYKVSYQIRDPVRYLSTTKKLRKMDSDIEQANDLGIIHLFG